MSPADHHRARGLLDDRFRPLLARVRRLRLVRRLGLLAAIAVPIAWLLRLGEEHRGWDVDLAWAALLVGTLGAAAALWWRTREEPDDLRAAARLIERRHPELRALLVTAVEQTPTPGGRLGFLQERLLLAAVGKVEPALLDDVVPVQKMRGFTAATLLGGLLFGYAAFTALVPDLPSFFDDDHGLRVSPGDTEVERGRTVLVLARFERQPPSRATLVVRAKGKPPVRLEMRRSLADPVWGASTPTLATGEAAYDVEHDGGRSPRYRIRVFQTPDVERLDARIEYPQPTADPGARGGKAQAAREVADARFLSVVEGARVIVTAHLAGPAKRVELVAPESPGQAAETLAASMVDGDRRRFRITIDPRTTRRYDVRIRDDEGREDDTPPRLTIEVHRNRPPEITQGFPGRDVRVSPIEELNIEANIKDDTAIVGHGYAYRLSGGTTREVRLAGPDATAAAASPTTSMRAKATIALEELGAEPDQVLTYHFWAEDRDAKGKLRRSAGDLYYAEVRPFEERYHEGADDGGEGEGEGGGGALANLGRRQKEIMNATWRLEREARDGRALADLGKDAAVVAKGQDETRQAAEAQRNRAQEGKTRTALAAAISDMTKARAALSELASRGEKGGAAELALPPLTTALEAEQRAYAALLRLRDAETSVTRGKKGQGGGESAESQALSGLELKQKESRYESRREARGGGRQPTPDREALSRLDELARRQKALAERMKEAEAAHARNEDPAEQERRLKRLREEQQEMIEDLDALGRRLERPAGGEAEQKRLQRTRAELAEVRKEASAAALALARGDAAQALGAGKRAERRLDQSREELAKDVARGFADELRQLRQDARALDEEQRKLSEALAGQPTAGEPAMAGAGGQASASAARNGRAGALEPGELGEPARSPTEARRIADQLRRQKEAAEKLLGDVEAVSAEAEATSPLLSRKLYDGLREARMSDLESSLGAASELFERNLDGEGRLAAERARKGAGELRQRVDDAAKGVLGDEVESLRAAESELDALIAAAEREAAPAASKGKEASASARQPGEGAAGQPAGTPENPTGGGGEGRPGPITGNGFREFSERLRDLQDLLEDGDLRDQAAAVGDRVRSMRSQWRERGAAPTSAVLEAQVLRPLLELRNRVAQDLRRVQRNDKIVPLDRDPIPSRYTDLVRRYWKSLSEGR